MVRIIAFVDVEKGEGEEVRAISLVSVEFCVGWDFVSEGKVCARVGRTLV